MAAPSRSTIEGCVSLDEEPAGHSLSRLRARYAAATIILTALIASVVVDGLDLLDTYGVDDAHVRATAGGYELDVRYATVSRPGLATPFEITVTRHVGGEDPVTVAVSSSYLSMWDENGLDPTPAESTSTERDTLWTFDVPSNDETLRISFDARIEPAAQTGKPGRVAVVDETGADVVSVSFRTRLMP
jgi:hypothetical protein